MKLSEIPSDRLVAAYIQLRDRRTQRKAAFTADDAGDRVKQDKIEVTLLRRFQQDGVESIRTNFGTAYKSVVSSVTAPDWDSFFEYVREANSWDLMERRPSKVGVVQYREEHGDLPPGISMSETVTVNVRRS